MTTSKITGPLNGPGDSTDENTLYRGTSAGDNMTVIHADVDGISGLSSNVLIGDGLTTESSVAFSVVVGASTSVQNGVKLATILGCRAAGRQPNVDYGIAIGASATYEATAAIVIGGRARARDDNTIAIGYLSDNNGNESIAIGRSTKVSIVANNAIALGDSTEAQVSSQVTFGDRVLRMGQYTVTTQPTAADYSGHMIYVANGAAGSPTMAFSDGTNWLRTDNNTATSVA